jgi:hypothetical protein
MMKNLLHRLWWRRPKSCIFQGKDCTEGRISFSLLQFCNIFVLPIGNDDNIAMDLNDYPEGGKKSRVFREIDSRL